jgi:hypothetical protein
MPDNRPFNFTPGRGRGIAGVDDLERSREDHQARMRAAIELEHLATGDAPRRGLMERIRALVRR